MVSIRVEMYRRLASVRVRPRWAYHASLLEWSVRIGYDFLGRGVWADVPLLALRVHLRGIPNRSIHHSLHVPLCAKGYQSHHSSCISRSTWAYHSPILCLYKPYSFNRSAAGGRAVPVRGILLTVFKAWTKTRSAHSGQWPVCVIGRGNIGRYAPTESDMLKDVP